MKKILIVEDDFYISKLYQRTFNLAGFEVDTAVSGKQALEKSQTGTYDVILLDVMLGDMSGLDVLKLWRAPDHRFKTTPVFLSTNRGEDAIVKQGFTLGMEGYFYKSQYVPQDIVNEINAFFSRQEDGSAAGAAAPAPVAADQPQSAGQSAPVSPVAEAPPPSVSVEPPASPAIEPIISSAVPTVMPQEGAMQPPPQEGTMQYPPQESPIQQSPQESPMQYPPQESTMQYPPQGGAVQYPPQQFNQTGQPDPFAGSIPPVPMQPQVGALQYPPQEGVVQYPPQGNPGQYPAPSVSPYPPVQQPTAAGGMPQESAPQYPPQESTMQYPPQESTMQYPPQESTMQYPPQESTMQYPPQGGAVQYPQQQGPVPGSSAPNNEETIIVAPHIDGV